MATAIDSTPYETASISFSWLIESSLDKTEHVAVDVFDGIWRDVARLCGNVDAGNVWQHKSIEISAGSLVANFKVRFRATASDADEDANIDNV